MRKIGCYKASAHAGLTVAELEGTPMLDGNLNQ